ncbi:MAG: hypothetical protein WAW69_11715 [Polaromonas sp.]
MAPEKILSLLWGHGFHVSLTADDSLKVSPSSTLHPSLRELIRANKAVIVALLVEARKTTSWLIAAAMEVCDRHNDSDAAREEMRQDCLKLAPHLQQDLLDHFQGKTPVNGIIRFL